MVGLSILITQMRLNGAKIRCPLRAAVPTRPTVEGIVARPVVAIRLLETPCQASRTLALCPKMFNPAE